MSFVYRISPSGNHVEVVGTGRLTTRECIGLVNRILSDPRRHSNATALIDLRDATYRPRSLSDVIKIAQSVGAFHSLLSNNIAIVAQRSTLFLAEILSTAIRKATRVSIKVFVELSAARKFCRRA